MRASLRTLFGAGFTLILLLFGEGAGQEAAKESQSKKAAAFNGRWSNSNPAQSAVANAITRVDIHSSAERMFMRMWVKCRPVDCDWGEESAAIADAEKGEFTLTWRKDSLGVMQKISLQDDGLLRIEGQSRW